MFDTDDNPPGVTDRLQIRKMFIIFRDRTIYWEVFIYPALKKGINYFGPQSSINRGVRSIRGNKISEFPHINKCSHRLGYSEKKAISVSSRLEKPS